MPPISISHFTLKSNHLIPFLFPPTPFPFLSLSFLFHFPFPPLPLDENMSFSPSFHPNFILPTLDDNSLNPIFLSSNPHGFSRMLDMIGRRSVSFSGNVEVSDELSDESSQPGEKKRRLNMEQVRTLEKNFELGNKLEPERKIQLAKALGLQPRQIAIWFQNRRARWKTKQLEKDYDLLKRKFDAIKADNDSLQSQNKKLQAEGEGDPSLVANPSQSPF